MSVAVSILLFVLLGTAPLVTGAGLPCAVAVAVMLTVYSGARPRTVYGCAAGLLALEVLYPGMPGVLTVAYLAAVLVFLGARKFFAIPVWADRDGWHLRDIVQTVTVAWGGTVLTLGIAVAVAGWLYDAGPGLHRTWVILTPADAVLPFAVGCAAVVIVRRLAIPFRRVILFGT